MEENLHAGQTGFIPRTGIIVNQMRLIEEVKETMSKRRETYGLFIDPYNAYNTISNNKLFARLKKVLSTEEIVLIKAIYSRLKIQIGEKSFIPNAGVA